MILIADSGSTKTDWSLIKNDGSVESAQTDGCNPYFLDAKEMGELFANLRNKLGGATPGSIFFYGAGCTPGEKTHTVEKALRDVFGRECDINVHSDMVGAARALCQREEGIACILGTGSNSCLYDGRAIAANVSPLGFILGDEGSGANLGKLLVGNILKDQMGEELKNEFLEKFGPASDIIDRVYRKPLPNRWLASLSPFIHDHLGNEKMHSMAKEAFRTFFKRNIRNYDRPDLKIGMTGSVAYYYKDIISEVATELGLQMGTVTKSPMEGLVRYHKQ